MTAGKKFKRLVRDRAGRTGESYSTARRHLLRKRSEDEMSESKVDDDDEFVEVRLGRITAAGPAETPFLWDDFYYLVLSAEEERALDAVWGDSYYGDWA